MNYTRNEILAVYRVLSEIAIVDGNFHQKEQDMLVAVGVHFGLGLDDHIDIVNIEFADAVNKIKYMNESKKNDIALTIKEIIFADSIVHEEENRIVEYLKNQAQITPWYLL